MDQLIAGTPVLNGDQFIPVSEELAAAWRSGDLVIAAGDELLHVPAAERSIAAAAVGRAAHAFAAMATVSDDQISSFFGAFADRLADPGAFTPIAAANAADIDAARARGRSTTRLILSDTMRSDMIDGLRSWAIAPSGRGEVIGRVAHTGWEVEQVRAGVGAVGFVFEGRPNVFADACGVIRSGNTVVFRIGSDALGTARAIVEHALDPALGSAGLPEGAASLVDSAAHAAGWAMFADPRLSLAVARGSGRAVTQLGTVARQAGVPVSLHGTGGAWIVASGHADADAFGSAVRNSLDRKVCNTLNTCCITADRVDDLVPVFLSSIVEAAERRGTRPRLHVLAGQEHHVPKEWFSDRAISRAGGAVMEPGCSTIAPSGLGTEWEWEDSPEVSLCIVESVDDAAKLFNEHSPHFVASLISGDDQEQRRFFELVDAPFVGNGFTRWVDGQYALGAPELGLSNWQFGRLFGRGGVLSGDSVFTVRLRVTQTDPGVHR